MPDYEYEPCTHDCFDNCDELPDGRYLCHHEHCMSCGGCNCPGYCDDYQTYNLRPAETGAPPPPEGCGCAYFSPGIIRHDQETCADALVCHANWDAHGD